MKDEQNGPNLFQREHARPWAGPPIEASSKVELIRRYERASHSKLVRSLSEIEKSRRATADG
jgi:hypothetical protein